MPFMQYYQGLCNIATVPENVSVIVIQYVTKYHKRDTKGSIITLRILDYSF